MTHWPVSALFAVSFVHTLSMLPHVRHVAGYVCMTDNPAPILVGSRPTSGVCRCCPSGADTEGGGGGGGGGGVVCWGLQPPVSYKVYILSLVDLSCGGRD